MLTIKGTYQAEGTQSDGDTIHFTPDDPAEWGLVGGVHKVRSSALGRGKLRLDGVDALETHYSSAPRVHQPLPLAHAAADELLSWLGFSDVQRGADETVIKTVPGTVPGFVFARGADVHGRCVALAGRGETSAVGGSETDVDTEALRATVNHHLLNTGLAYPMYYRGLPQSLREGLTDAVNHARSVPAKGVWAQDVTMSGAEIAGLSTLTDEVTVLPKLFRRMVDYLKLGQENMGCLPAFLGGVQDRFTIASTGERVIGLHRVVSVADGRTVGMTQPVEDLVFEEG
ncbi:nuclease [Streptomyces sp. bgisy091]|uniref:nuclease n=1 Tax=Streptomyces sp. bgisy091 TaxID=3413778 RepID=UPI003D75202B